MSFLDKFLYPDKEEEKELKTKKTFIPSRRCDVIPGRSDGNSLFQRGGMRNSRSEK